MKYLIYLKALLIHKWMVLRECFKYGLIWRGIIHDMSKFLPSEFKPYSDFFGVSTEERTPLDKETWVYAWVKHCNRNDHHWQYWVHHKDTTLSPRILEMSDKAKQEMLCDWRAANQQHGTMSLVEWYRQRQDFILLGPKTKRWLRKELGL